VVIPAPFQSRRALAALSVGAVGVSMAAITAAGFGLMFQTGVINLIAGGSTLVVGTLWAALLRRPETMGKSRLRWGWVASVPLAMLNAAISAALLVGAQHSSVGNVLGGAIVGATFGAVFWIPALMFVLACFGLPIARAQWLARKGLAGEERGDAIVGMACVATSVLALLIARNGRHDVPAGTIGLWVTRAFGLLGAIAGASSIALARSREARRRAFVVAAEAGEVPGFRVDPTPEGKVLVRVVDQGEGYRVADYEQAIFELDAEGEATRAKRLAVEA
jgi:hypothetical protein